MKRLPPFVATLRPLIIALAFCAFIGKTWAGAPLPVVTVSSADPAADEAGQDVATFTVTRDVNSSQPLTVSLDISGDATRGVDYTLPGVFGGAPFAVTIPANQTSEQFTLTPNADNIVEDIENVDIALQAGTGYVLGSPNSVQLSIADDVPEVNLSLIDGAMAELGLDPGSFRVTRSNNGDITRAITVNVAIAGSATRGVDYNSGNVFGGAPFAVSIPANELEVVTTFTPFVDNVVEGDETIEVTLQPNASVYTVGTQTQADFTLTDDVPEVNLTLIDGEMAELGLDPGSFRVTRTNNGDITRAITVNVAIAGSATRGVDYNSGNVFGGVPFAVSIPANELEVVTTFTPFVDNVVEGDETIAVTLQPNANVYTVGAQTQADFTLTDDVPEVNLTLIDGEMAETGLDPGSFRVTRSNNGDITRAITVNIAVTGTATRGVDYNSGNVVGGAPFAVSIPANEMEVVTTFTPFADNVIEGDETIAVTLQPNASIYTIGTQTLANFTLTDDVPEVNLTLIDGVMAEQDLDPGSFRVTRSNNGDITRAIVVNIAIEGSATRGVDYNSGNVFGGSPFAVSIPANELEVITTFTPISDGPDNEDDETINITLQAGTNYTVGPDTTAMLTLADLIDALFADSFEDPVSGKACDLSKSLDQSEFFDQGPSILDLTTGLSWAKCGLSAGYQWEIDECSENPSPLRISPADQLLLFNEGFIGDNAGFNDWRMPSASERQSLPAPCQTVVR